MTAPDAVEHYDRLLAPRYTWMLGGDHASVVARQRDQLTGAGGERRLGRERRATCAGLRRGPRLDVALEAPVSLGVAGSAVDCGSLCLPEQDEVTTNGAAPATSVQNRTCR